MLTATAPTKPPPFQALFERQKAHHAATMRHTDSKARKERLLRLKAYILSHRQQIQEALWADFRKPAPEVDLTEIFSTVSDIRHAVSHLNKWMRPRRVSTPLTLLGSSARVVSEPKGVTLIIAPWNYPFFLALGPLVYAIAAGNCAIIKPSELTPHTSALISQMIAELFPPEEVAVAEGGVEVSTDLLSLPFDHIFFTGSPQVGKIVMEAASRHLTSVTLELGGKSPTIVDPSANVEDAAEKIVWGKFLNNGQTCIAPDYVLVHDSVQERLLEAMKAQVQRFYNPTGVGVQNSGAYARVVNDRHFGRLTALMAEALEKGAKVITGGRTDPAQRFIEPTILAGVPTDSRLMNEEIFGPILPVLPFHSLDEAIGVIRAKEKPLALYIFSKDSGHIDKLMANTSAGGTCINECLLHISNPNLPFGGVNHSGIGKSHGYYGFQAFSNERAVLRQRVGFTSLKPLYPPYTPTVRRMIDWLVKWF